MTTTLHKRDIGKRTCATTTDSNSHLDGPSPGAVQSTPDPVDREALRRAILDHLDAIGVDRNQSEAVLDKPSIRDHSSYAQKDGQAAHTRHSRESGNPESPASGNMTGSLTIGIRSTCSWTR